MDWVMEERRREVPVAAAAEEEEADGRGPFAMLSDIMPVSSSLSRGGLSPCRGKIVTAAPPLKLQMAYGVVLTLRAGLRGLVYVVEPLRTMEQVFIEWGEESRSLNVEKGRRSVAVGEGGGRGRGRCR